MNCPLFRENSALETSTYIAIWHDPSSHVLFYSFSVVFWFGDLNYRIDLPNETVRSFIDANNYHDLVEHDQVSEEVK